MLELKISAANAQELVEQIGGLRAALASATATVATPVEDKPARKPRAAKAANDEAPAEQAEEKPAEPAAEEKPAKLPEEAAAEAIKYSDVQSAVTKLAAAKGRQAVIDVFGQFGVDHGSKLTEEQWPEAIAALDSARQEAA